MTARLEPHGAGCWALSGELDRAAVAALWPQGAQLARAGARVELDLAGVRRADSAGVALLVEWLRLAREAGGDIAYAAAPAQMRAILRISDLEEVLGLG